MNPPGFAKQSCSHGFEKQLLFPIGDRKLSKTILKIQKAIFEINQLILALEKQQFYIAHLYFKAFTMEKL